MDDWDRKMAEINATLDRVAKRQEEAAKWREESDKWRAESDKWREESDKWRAKSDKWREESDKWRAKADKLRAEAEERHAKQVAEAEQRHKRHAQWMAEADRRHAKQVAEAEERRKRHEKWREESDRRLAKMEKKSRKLFDDLAAQLKDTQATLSGVGISNGMVAEDVVFEAMGKRLMFGGVKFDRVGRTKTDIVVLPDGRRIEGEFDIILYNCTSFAMIDVKYRVRKDDLDYLVNVQMPKFKVVFPQYKDYKVYLGIGGMTFDRGVVEAALERGIGVLKLGDNLVKEVRDENVKVW